ncbi:hypothetical protein [Amycolatopsis saalfeldensis]|uniref:Uncharacterized protein n=1 Tax=Amycolatopsis saalfeldensis TaxID=394193 RepID=A0A1H8XLA1_9PSEU|nr:hypothetical protein [Amycolatopsis saalfeldensis]SEP40666.1 hypothetical protein SAMN04489732_10823 [Amycolatopsis saalfeldensis]
MEPDDQVRVLLSQVTDGPPMRLDASDVIARGGRVRRRRKRWAVAGSSAATAAVLVVAGFAVGHRAGAPAPVEPARPGLSTVAPAPSPLPTPGVLPPAQSSGPISPPRSQTATGPHRPQPATTPGRAPRSPVGAPSPPAASLPSDTGITPTDSRPTAGR